MNSPADLAAPDLARYIDHTQLKPETTQKDIDLLCDEAEEYGFATVCVNPFWVERCVQRLNNISVGVASVVGFPLGATTTEIKVKETEMVCSLGAAEVDMVINIGAFRSRKYGLVRADIEAVVEQARSHQSLTKVIIETALLTQTQKRKASQLTVEARADMVKTSTGFSGGGATVEDVTLLRQTIPDHIGLKASGGIRTADQVREMLAAGASRIGASAGVTIVTGQNSTGSSY